MSELDTTAGRPFHRPSDEPFPKGNIHVHGIAQYSPEAAEAFSIPVPATTHDSIPPLFQTPQQPLSSICPQRWPGIDAESTKILLRLLEDNHSRWHIFFNYKGFHKCALHTMCICPDLTQFEVMHPITFSRSGRWARAQISFFLPTKLISSISVLRLTHQAKLRAKTFTSILAMNGE
jgi:hypothetical protein